MASYANEDLFVSKFRFALKALGVSLLGGMVMAVIANFAVALIYGWIPERAIYLTAYSILGFMGIGFVLIFKVLRTPR